MASKIKLSNANGKIVTIENNDSNMSDVTLNGASITKKVDTLADMRAMNELPETVWCSGYHSKNDGVFGSHFYRLKGLKTTETDNSGTVIIVSVGGSDYVYELQFDGAVNVKWFGAVGDITVSCSEIIQDIFNAGIKTLHFPQGFYYFDTAVEINSAGMGDETLRNISITCDRNAIFTNKGGSNNIFDISGQRRFNFTGGKFVEAVNCFNASGDVPVAYSKFTDVIFEGGTTDSISRCYKADTSIGVTFDNCRFGSDQANDQIDIAVEFTGVSSQQTNINVFNDCSFLNMKTSAVKCGNSGYLMAVLSFNGCWFETISGYALDIDFAQAVGLESCYFEACGDGTNPATKLKDIISFQIDNSYIAIQNGYADFAKIENGGTYKFGIGTRYTSVNDSRLLMLSSFIGEVYCESTLIGSSGTAYTYEECLYSGTSGDSNLLKSKVNFKTPYLSSTLNDSTKEVHNHHNYNSNGVIFNRTTPMNLVAQDTFYDIATIKITNAAHTFRITIESYQTIQGVGHSGRFEEYVVHWNGTSYTATSLRTQDTITGYVFNINNVDTNTVTVQAKRTKGSSTITPISALLCIYQATSDLYSKPVYVENI